MNNIKIVFLVFFVQVSLDVFAGGPWVKSKKSTYFQLGYSTILPNNKLFSRGNDFLLLPFELSDRTVNAYLEYGLTDKFTFISYLPYKMIKTQGEFVEDNSFESLFDLNKNYFKKTSLRSFGNVELEGKYQFYNKNSWGISSSIKVSVPTSARHAIAHLQSGFDSWGIQPEFSIGYSESRFYGFMNLAYNHRPRITDELKMALEIGYQFYKSIYVILAIDILESARKLSPINSRFYYIYSDQQEYIASTLKFSIPIKKDFGVNLHMTIKTIEANYVQKGPSMGGSIYWKI